MNNLDPLQKFLLDLLLATAFAVLAYLLLVNLATLAVPTVATGTLLAILWRLTWKG